MASEQEETRIDEAEFKTKTWTRTDEIKESLHMLVSHHPPSLFGHCLRLTFRGRSIYFCARCSGIYGGMGLGIVFLFIMNFSLTPDWLWFLLALVFGMTTVVDWMSQRLTPRKTTNGIRFWTGFFSGLGLAIVFYLANLFYMLVALTVMGLSVGVVGAIENRQKRDEVQG